MKRKKHKHARRAMRFYRINFGFRPPYKILVDGNFVSAVNHLKRGDCVDLISGVLGDKSRVFTTKCCMHELSTLGAEQAGTRKLCKKYALHQCGHDEPVSASECLLSQVKEDGINAQHFFIASQDRALQNKIMSLPGGAVMFATVNGVQLEMPSDRQKLHVLKTGQEKMKPGVLERQGNLIARTDGSDKSGSKFRHKKTKGPNPLSIKRKKAKPEEQQQMQASASEDKSKRKRVRKSRQQTIGTEDTES